MFSSVPGGGDGGDGGIGASSFPPTTHSPSVGIGMQPAIKKQH